MTRLLTPLLSAVMVLSLALFPAALLAAPVSWVEVTPTEAGRQWWDEGSLRRNRTGNLTVLSRFQPAATEAGNASGSLYVMELDCDQRLYRDVSVNGLPRWQPAWQDSDSDGLTAQVVQQVCLAGPS